ncbi:MAG: hypothetical protein K2Y71_02735 [Xanthobacteraceae bacterium]|nr:hypothetical protein [Xanthobacteraceae bacterium]
MALSHSQSVLAAIGDDLNDCATDPQTRPWTAVFVIASPRPANGKTFLARLIVDFLRMNGGPVEAFELSPGDEALSDQLPDLTTYADVESTKARMRLFDRLILADGIAKVIDLGHLSFQRFFSVMEQIEFVEAAQRRSLDVIVLYAADAHPKSVAAYGILQKFLPSLIMVPVFNDGILKGKKLRDQYPFTRAAAVPIQIPLLLPGLKAHAERSGLSFIDFHSQASAPVPLGPAFELRSWTKRVFLEFREFELRLLMEKVKTSLKG